MWNRGLPESVPELWLNCCEGVSDSRMVILPERRRILNSGEFAQRTNLADYALWLRGRALQQAGNHAEAMSVFAKLVNDFPDTLNANDARLKWAESASRSGRSSAVPDFLRVLNEKNSGPALLETARSYETSGNQAEAIRFYRKAYFYSAGSDAAKEAETKLTALGQNLSPVNADEGRAKAERLFALKSYAAADKAFSELLLNFPTTSAPTLNLKRLETLANVKKMAEAKIAFHTIPASAAEKEAAYYQLAVGYAKARMWPDARATVEEMRQKYPAGKLTPKAFVDCRICGPGRQEQGRGDVFPEYSSCILSECCRGRGSTV